MLFQTLLSYGMGFKVIAVLSILLMFKNNIKNDRVSINQLKNFKCIKEGLSQKFEICKKYLAEAHFVK